MGKLRDKRRERKLQKRKDKYGVNPVTGKILTRKEKKRIDKYGYNEDGTINSKRQQKFKRKSKKQDIKEKRIDGRNAAKENRTAGRRAKKEGKGAKKASEGRATEELAYQGIDSQAAQKRAIGDAIGKSVEGISEAVSSIYGGGQIEEQPTITKSMNVNKNEKKSNNVLMIVGIGVIALIASAIMLLKKNKKKKRRR